MKKYKILVCVLDWGLGHATRCIPVIRYLQEKGQDVIIAGSGNSLAFLKKEFPVTEFIELPAYNIYYGSGGSQVWSMLKQAGKINRVIKQEQNKISKLVREKDIDIVISDNRYGCYAKQARSIIITHQAGLLMPSNFTWLEFLPHYWLKQQLGHFNECWIPDTEGSLNLSGRLSHHFSVPVAKKYIGPLTRFSFKEKAEKKYDVAAILSGPEPQRTLLEEKLIAQFKLFPEKKFIIAAGKGGDEKRLNISSHIEYISCLTSQEINKVVVSSEIIISRSGYSTIMDLHKSNKKIIFIPTPGQTEQEYLAGYMAGKNFCVVQVQQTLNLENAFGEIEKVKPFYMELQEEYKEVIDELLGC